jgi:hypothetical protein
VLLQVFGDIVEVNCVMTDNSTIGFIIVDSNSMNLTLCGSVFPPRGLAPRSLHNNELLFIVSSHLHS